jgi:hypothetical protein
VELLLFEEVAEDLRALVAAELGEPRQRAHRYGVKVWFGSDQPSREHYEAQVIGAKHVEHATVLALEIGFHLEHPRSEDNDAVLALLKRRQKSWRSQVGDEAVAGPFLGRPDDWRRVSETWPDPDLGAPDLAFEIAARLADYIAAIEPIVRAR